MESKIKATEEQRAYACFSTGDENRAGDAGGHLRHVSRRRHETLRAGRGPRRRRLALPVMQGGAPRLSREAHIHPGWWWLSQLGKGDFVNFLGIAFSPA